MRRFLPALLAACLCLAAAEPFALTVDSIMRGPALTGYAPRDPRWSGDGKRVYFEWKQAGDPLRNDFNTYSVERDGTGLRKLSNRDAKLVPPVAAEMNEERTLSVYVREGDLYVYDHSTDRGRALTATVEAESNPHLTRDSKRVAFTRGGNLFVMAIDSGRIVQITDIRPPGDPVPPAEKKGTESQEYLKREERELLDAVKDRALRREEEGARRKEENPRKPLRLTGKQTVAALRLSPDEKTVFALINEPAENAKTAIVPAFVTESAYTEPLNARIKVGDAPEAAKLALIDAATGEVRYVEAPGLKERSPRLTMPVPSPDGRRAYVTAFAADNKDWWIFGLDLAAATLRIVANVHDDAWVSRRTATGWMKDSSTVHFVSERDGYSHLYSVPFDGGEPRQLTSGRWEVFDARLSRDRNRFFLETNEQDPGERHLYVMDAAGGARTKLTSGDGVYEESAVSPDESRIASVYSYVTKPPELVLFNSAPGSAAVKVTNSPLPEFWQYPWRDAPIVEIPARDGVRVRGRLYPPAKPVRGGAAVIFVHGAGYLQNVHKGWSNYYREYMFHHLLAERGYTVLDIDYRGSANYGRDWRTAIYRYMGGKDLDDHVDAAKWLVAQHGIDPKRIGIYGGSYGGFITLMAMFTQPDLFAAGAALRPVTDWAHYNHPYTSNILNTPEKDAEAYRRSSPIYFAQGLKGALLLCHGMVDVNVHVQDTIRLAQKLIELRKENWEMALYPVEDHTFVQPTSWADEYKRILKLFEANLKPGPGASGGTRRAR